MDKKILGLLGSKIKNVGQPSSEDITNAVNSYLAANPVQAMSDSDIATSVNNSIASGAIDVITVDGGEFETKEQHVTDVTLNFNSYSLAIGDTFTLEAFLSPSNATNKNVTYSANNDYCSISQDGLVCNVTGISEGESVVTVKTEDGNYEKTCSVNIYNNDFMSYGETTTILLTESSGDFKLGTLNDTTGGEETHATRYLYKNYLSAVPNMRYSVASSALTKIYFYDSEDNFISCCSTISKQFNFVAPSNCEKIRFWVNGISDSWTLKITPLNNLFNKMLEIGENGTEFDLIALTMDNTTGAIYMPGTNSISTKIKVEAGVTYEFTRIDPKPTSSDYGEVFIYEFKEDGTMIKRVTLSDTTYTASTDTYYIHCMYKYTYTKKAKIDKVS